MKYFKWLRFIFLICLYSTSYANQATDNLIAIFKHINTIQGDFTQTIENQSDLAIANSKGNFILQRPNHFRWEVTTPLKQLTVADGQKIWLYQPDLQQATVTAMSKRLGQTPLVILSGSTTVLRGNYTISQPHQGNTFILIPKNSASEFNRIELTIVKQKLTQMILFDSLGQKTRLQFNHVILNKTINEKLFQFTPSKDVDIIHS